MVGLETAKAGFDGVQMCPRDAPTSFAPGADTAEDLGGNDNIVASDVEISVHRTRNAASVPQGMCCLVLASHTLGR